MSEIEQLNALVGNLVLLLKIGGSVGGLGALYGLVALIRAWRGKDEEKPQPVQCVGGLSSEEKRQMTEMHVRSIEMTETQQSMAHDQQAMAHELTRLSAAVERVVDKVDRR